MRKAYDIILSDYVNADAAAKNEGFEPYRYECACCWEEVRLCAANSRNQATHFRHRSGNNSVECENYLGYPSNIISNALSSRNFRDKFEFYFSNMTKMFSIGVKFTADEIAVYEQNGESFQVGNGYSESPMISIPISGYRFLPDNSEFIPISEFSWEYAISFTNNSKIRKYELFCKDGRNNLYPSFFKMQAGESEENFQAKLVHTNTLYTNTPYLIVFTHRQSTLNFQKDIQVSKVFEFKTMGRDFTGVIVTFINKTAGVEQQLDAWKYKLKVNETLTLLWPPSLQAEDTMFLRSKCAYVFSSFELQAHGNINVHVEDIAKLGEGVSKISVNSCVKVYKKNVELSLSNQEGMASEYDVISVKQEIENQFVAPDDSSYMFNNSGVSQIPKGMQVSLTTTSEVRHYLFGYLERVIIASGKDKVQNRKCILQGILMYYKREELFDWSDYEELELSSIAFQYIEDCEKTGRINSAAKHFIEEGHI